MFGLESEVPKLLIVDGEKFWLRSKLNALGGQLKKKQIWEYDQPKFISVQGQPLFN